MIIIYLTIQSNNRDSSYIQPFSARLFFFKLSHLNMQDFPLTPGMRLAMYSQSFSFLIERKRYQSGLNAMDLVKVSIFWYHPHQYLNVLFAPVLFEAFVLDHPSVREKDTFLLCFWPVWGQFSCWGIRQRWSWPFSSVRWFPSWVGVLRQIPRRRWILPDSFSWDGDWRFPRRWGLSDTFCIFSRPWILQTIVLVRRAPPDLGIFFLILTNYNSPHCVLRRWQIPHTTFPILIIILWLKKYPYSKKHYPYPTQNHPSRHHHHQSILPPSGSFFNPRETVQAPRSEY